MGIKYTNYVWDTQKDVKGTRLLLLLAYADYAGEDGSSWSSCPGMADRIRGSETNLRALDKELMAAHKIIKVPGKGKETPFGKTNLTVIVAPGINCQDYADLCKQWKIKPLSYKALPEDNRYGRNPFRLNSTPLLNSSEPPLEFNTPPLLESTPDPSSGTINDLSIDSAAGAAGNGAFFSDSNKGSESSKTYTSNPIETAEGSKRPRDLVLDALIAHLFEKDLSDKAQVRGAAGRAVVLKKILVTEMYPDMPTAILVQHIERFPSWYRKQKEGADLPLGEKTFPDHFSNYVASISQPSPAVQQAASAPRRIRPSCDDPNCRNGYVKTAQGRAMCPSCWEQPEG